MAGRRISSGPRTAGDPDGQLGRADRRRPAEQGRGVDRLGQRAVHAPRLSRLGGDDQGGGRAARVGADRLRHDRHAQRRPLRPGRRRGGRGDRRALREAADDHAGRGPAPPRHGPLQGHAVRRRLHLHRLPDGHARPRAGPRRRDRRDPQGRGVVSPGLAGHQARGRQPEAGRVAGRPVQGRRLGMRRRHRHPRL